MNGSNFARKRAHATYDVIPPENAPTRRRTVQRPVEIVDVDFEVINSPLRAHYEILNDNRFGKRGSQTEIHWSVVMFYAALLSMERLLERFSTKGFAGLVGASFLVVFAGIFFFSGGQPAVREKAQGGVAVTALSTSVLDSNGLRIVEVTGSVKNVTGRDLPTPQLSAHFESSGDTPSITVFKLDQPVLSAGQSAPFSLRMPHPGGKLPKVSVSAGAAQY
ncbi:hypothetical protein [Rhizobium sp. L1K21]|uniref:hypothetical protein n=1 Tax=Rhizobium sp. L1K21 TaxID=2954933 RepID=UPI00209271D6|nr:hypothetical protein [Rhizobium sp. L1K21]MCO6188170.1 hypothetical protein [Rhizobium sp. L1K21]